MGVRCASTNLGSVMITGFLIFKLSVGYSVIIIMHDGCEMDAYLRMLLPLKLIVI